ncbi:DUF3367 domain-containing protein [Janibacter melonis]|uniref:DUF3367 domain-containing protein n=2 Tax=Janibacter melonis TaxID=262209 RepID=A0A5P8FLM3_9MICO|nr:alpha-(1->3)-arabinofuranosyltransferase family protein [Janibacter melonis]QFQ30083.2 DUF3367 domain-containing protein [Janibacter melonis]
MEPPARPAPAMSAAHDERVAVLRARWHRLLVVAGLALLPWLVAPGRVQPDTKLDLTVSPWRYLERSTHAWSTHNGVGELQNQAYGYLFPMGPVHGVLTSLGMPAWGVQRVWWALVLVVAVLGAERLLRRLGVPGTVPALLGGALYALSPRVLTMLSESSVELWPYALAPWLVLVVLPLADPAAGWPELRRSAVRTSALTVCLGGVNATVDLFALAPAALWVLAAARGRTRRRAAGLWLLAVLAGSAWWLAPLLVLGRYSYPFLDYIELAATTTGVTGAVNVLRGADHWLAYILTDADHPVWQSGWVLAQSAVAVVATCVLAGLALAGLLAHRAAPDVGRDADRDVAPDRDPVVAASRRWALVCLLLGVVVMAVGRTGTASGPLAPLVQDLLDGPAAPLRNVHKADLLVRLPLALGAALLAARVGSPAPGRRVLRQAGAVALTLAVVGSVLPVWQGRVADAWGYERIPLEVRQTAGDLDRAAQRDGGSTLVLPSARMAHLSWGRTNDEPLGALAESPVLVRAAAPLGHPGSTRLVDRVDRLASSGRAQPELASALRRLGVSRVVLRYDGAPDEPTSDPFAMEAALVASPGIEHVRTRGAGRTALTQWAVAPDPAVTQGVRSDPVGAVTVAAASPEGVLDLEATGVVRPGAPVVLAGDAGPLGRDPQLVTDTLRWQLYNAGRPAASATSPTVAQDDPRPGTTGARALPPGDVLGRATTRTWPGYRSVEVSSTGADPFAGARAPASAGPGALVDGDPTTTWVSDPDDPDPRVVLEPDRPLDGGATPVVVTVPDGPARPARLAVSIPGGGAAGYRDDVAVPATGRRVTLTVPSGGQRVEIAPQRAAGSSVVGLSEVDLGATPTYPWTRRAGTALTLPAAPGAEAALLTRDPRAAASTAQGEDPASLRRSVSGLDGDLAVTAWLRPRPGAALEHLLDRGWDLAGSTRGDQEDVGASLRSRPGAALDGDPQTRWQPDPGEDRPRLVVDLGSAQPVSQIRLGARLGGLVRVTTDTGAWLVPAQAGALDVPAGTTRRVELVFERSGEWVAPEVELVGPARSAAGPVTTACGQAGRVRVDGAAVDLEVTASPDQLIAGTVLPARTCPAAAPVARPEGIAVEAVAGEAFVPERVLLRTPGAQPGTTPTPARAVEGVSGEAEDRTITLGAGGDSVVTTDQGANRGWRATDAEGRVLRPVTVDGWRQGFVVPAGEAGAVRVNFVPSTTHRVGLAVGGVLAVVALLAGAASLLGGRRRSVSAAAADVSVAGPDPGRPMTDGRTTAGPAPVWGAPLLAALVGLLVAGPLGLLAAAAASLVPARARSAAVVTLLGVAGVALAVLGVAERQSLGALVAQLLGSAVLGLVSAGLLRPRATRPAPAAGAAGPDAPPPPR